MNQNFESILEKLENSNFLWLYCNCNYILITKLHWPGDSEGTFPCSSQAATCTTPVYHTQQQRLYTLILIAEHQAGKL